MIAIPADASTLEIRQFSLPDNLLAGTNPMQAANIIAYFMKENFQDRVEAKEELAKRFRPKGRGWEELDLSLANFASNFYLDWLHNDDILIIIDQFRVQIQNLKKTFTKNNISGNCAHCWRTVKNVTTKPTLCDHHNMMAVDPARVRRERMSKQVGAIWRTLRQTTPSYREVRRNGDVENWILTAATNLAGPLPHVAAFLAAQGRQPADIWGVCEAMEIWPDESAFLVGEIYERLRVAEAWLTVEAARRPGRPRR